MKHFYAIYDTTVSTRNPGHGFCNSKRAIAFSSKEKRDAFLDGRSGFDFTSKAITRGEALKMVFTVDPNSGDRGLALDQTDEWVSSIVLKPGR